MRTTRWLGWIVVAGVAGATLWFGLPEVPPRWLPWAPIRLGDAPNFLTGYKLKRLADNPASAAPSSPARRFAISRSPTG